MFHTVEAEVSKQVEERGKALETLADLQQKSGDEFPGSDYHPSDRKTWMSGLGPEKIHINKVVWPGTHDSATNGIGIMGITRPLAECQTLSIYDQLVSGTRVLDIRINEEKHVCHGILSSYAVQDVLNDIKKFLSETDSEVIILEIRTESGQKDPPEFDKYLSDELGEFLIHQDDQVFTKTIAELLPKRVICIWKPRIINSPAPSSTAGSPPPLWSSGYLKDNWIDTELPWTKFESNLKYLVEQPPASNRNFFYRVENTVTPQADNVDDLTTVRSVTGRIHGYARLFIAQCFSKGIADRLQILSTDFIEEDFVDACVGLTRARIDGLKTLLCNTTGGGDADEKATQPLNFVSKSSFVNVLPLIRDLLGSLSLEMDGEELTEQETALYDRQIRVWGVDAQRRLSKAHVLVSVINGTIVEFCKNIVLAGVGSLTLMDDRMVTEEALAANFLLTPDENLGNDRRRSIAEVCCDALREFNPRVHVSVEKGDFSTLDSDFYDRFSAVVVGHCSLATKKLINQKCRKRPKQIAFYAVEVRDSCGEIFVDLQNYSYAQKKLDETTECQLKYSSFEDSVATPWRALPRKLSKLYFAMRVIERFEQDEGRSPGESSIADLPSVLKLRKELCEAQSLNESHIPESLLERLLMGKKEHPPVCAIIGGILGQEVIKVISGKGDPLKNFFFFDAVDGKGIIEDISNSNTTTGS